MLVAVYSKLFNARSTFERDDVKLRPVAIVLDDAHTGIEKIRDAFTVTWENPGKKPGDLYFLVQNLVIDSLRQQNLGKAESILMQDRYAVMEVPYWTWHTNLPQITRKLAQESDSQALLYKWGFVRDDLYAMRCIISGSSFEISPEVINFRAISAYHNADHRIFMSATLAEDSVLVLDLDCNSNAVLNPIMPKSDRGIGERMILVPTLFDRRLKRKVIQEWLGNLSQNFNVVVLAPSYRRAKTWQGYGAQAVIGKGVDKVVKELRQGICKFVAFANRYDGIDLPDDACRVLVIDGLPRGDSLYDALERELSETVHASISRMVHRIEQGMGRAVRSPSDYAVVMLLGNDIEAFVARSEALQSMSREAQAQIHLAHRLVELAKDEMSPPIQAIQALVSQCLKRDEGWKEFYRQEVIGFSRISDKRADLERRVELATTERQSLYCLLDGDHDKAGELLVRAGDEYATNNNQEKARLFQRAAHYIYPKNPTRALELQKKARDWNPKLLKPLKGVKYHKQSTANINEADQVIRWLSQFEHENAAIAATRNLKDRLRFDSDSETFEEALKELGQVLGAIAERPEREYGKGPDDIWLFSKTVFLIEAKNESRADLIPKTDGIGQLYDSLEWGNRHYPELKRVPIICHRQERAVATSNPSSDMRVLTPALLEKLLNNIENFIVEIIELPPADRNRGRISPLLQKHSLTSDVLIGKYTKRVRKK